MNIDIYRIDKDLPLPKYESNGAFAFDFIVRERRDIPPMQIDLIPANVIVKCPKDMALLVLPRSSLARKKGLLVPNSPGLIDADYCGSTDEIKIQVLNFRDKPVVIERGDRIAQGLFVKTENIQFHEVDSPSDVSRGGFGSTG